jgi:hypothetical protein
MSPSSAIEQLATFRAQNLRASQEFLEKASPLLKDVKKTRINDDGTFLRCAVFCSPKLTVKGSVAGD